MDKGTQLTGPQVLARLLQRVRSASRDELPRGIDRAGREIDLLLAHGHIDLITAESARTYLRSRLDRTQRTIVEYPIPVVIEICLLNSDQLSDWEKDFTLGIKQFSNLSARQFRRLCEIAWKFSMKPGRQIRE
jgi:hypothetical protein